MQSGRVDKQTRRCSRITRYYAIWWGDNTGFSYNLGFQGRVIQLGVVKVPLGKVHVDLAQEAVPAKGVVMPHGENERLGSEVLHANTILQRQPAGRFGSAIVTRARRSVTSGRGKVSRRCRASGGGGGVLLWGSRWMPDSASSFSQTFFSSPGWLCRGTGSFSRILQEREPIEMSHYTAQ